MRELVIARLTQLINDSDETGIPGWFDCDEEENITNPETLAEMTDEQLLECFETTIGFQG